MSFFYGTWQFRYCENPIHIHAGTTVLRKSDHRYLTVLKDWARGGEMRGEGDGRGGEGRGGGWKEGERGRGA